MSIWQLTSLFGYVNRTMAVIRVPQSLQNRKITPQKLDNNLTFSSFTGQYTFAPANQAGIHICLRFDRRL